MKFQETETVELKAVGQDDIKKEIIAFANCNGSTIYVGIADNGTVQGIDTRDYPEIAVRETVSTSVAINKNAPSACSSPEEEILQFLTKSQTITRREIQALLGVLGNQKLGGF